VLQPERREALTNPESRLAAITGQRGEREHEITFAIFIAGVLFAN
jgi:hypothetical protein